MVIGEILKKFRSDFKLTQLELSRLIGVSKSLIAMVESGERQLPPPAQIKLLHLQHEYSKAPLPLNAVMMHDVNEEAVSKRVADPNGELGTRLTSVKWLIWSHTQRLNKMNQTHLKHRAGALNMDLLKSALPPGHQAMAELNAKSVVTRKLLSGCDEEAQLRLALKIDILQAEEELITRYLSTQ